MTRLFLRFYLGVLFTLFIAWSVHSFVSRQRSEAANVRVVEQALGGGLRMAREQLGMADAEQRDAALQDLRQRFHYPVTLISVEEIPGYARQRFEQGDDIVLIGRGDSAFVVAPLPDAQVVQFGPLPKFVEPSQAEFMTGLGLVLLLAAAAIALLLRPVVRQLRLVERAALAFANGDLSARVDERRVNSARALAHAFNEMAGRTESLVRTQRELLQAVSHELRTPLSRIHFAIDLVRDARDQQQREARLASLEHASQELDDLVGELLRYVRLETSEPRLDIADVRLFPIVEDLIEKQSLVHPTKEFTIGPDLIRQDQMVLPVDPASLVRALGNLLGNAGRFARQRIGINATLLDDRVCIDVDDDGPGIAAADRQRVLEPFVRLDDSGCGAGLGLALVRRIVVHHGGTVTVETSPWGGCRIRTNWPSANLSQYSAATQSAAGADVS